MLSWRYIRIIVTAGCWANCAEGSYCLTLKIKAQRSVATSGTARPGTQPHFPDDLKLPSRRSAFRNVFFPTTVLVCTICPACSHSVYLRMRVCSHSSFLLTLTQHCCKLISNSCPCTACVTLIDLAIFSVSSRGK